ncbi:MAG TPA: biopolymer transporter ExbD [Persephonella sp.]|nr:biopolymer transporter ExbD [Hydrogenothermaceae bacterium]HIQ24841.1 biopolymer transporter ExbD [Persephonella sp.]
MRLIDDEEKEISEINMTPFVDIILVVLIIFMATATFIVERKIPLDLPEAETGEASKDKETIELVIKENGEILLNNKKTSIEDLKNKIKTLNKNKVVLIRSDKDTKFKYIVSVIDIFRKAGFEKYAVETILKR